MRRVATQLAVAIGMITSASLCGAVDLDRQIQFEIPAQKLDAALMEFSRQAKIQIVASTPNLSDYQTTGARGTLTIGEALGRLLGDSGLAIKEVGEETLAIVASKSEVATTTSVVDTNAMVRVASVSTQREGPVPASSTPQDATSVPKKIELEEVVVTGSHIRGVENSASPIYRFDRRDIAQSGNSTVEQFIQSLPQNFGGGNSFSTVGGLLGGEESNLNYGGGTGVNLRGLGNDSTLVLVNGRRVAPAGVGNYVDISMIPIGAVERMEVLADGASALYGSDAVAGVVNIILRQDFEGAESRVRYGSTSAGGSDELQIGQALGTQWNTGSAMLTYEYFDRSQLDSDERDFTREYPDRSYLIPSERRHGVLFSAKQRVSDRQGVFVNGSYSERASENWFNGFVQIVNDSRVRQYGGTIGSELDVGDSWRFDFSGGYSRNGTLSETVYSDVDYAPFNYSIELASDVWSADVKADGELFDLVAGTAKLAVGGHYRREAFSEITSTMYEDERDVSALFAELFVPVIGASNSSMLADRLEFTLAGRYERYSDFGSTFDPKLGVLWSPASGINLRGTIGTSFRAPLLSELTPSMAVTIAELFNQRTGGVEAMALIQGARGVLGPESSTAWTVGLDFEPLSVESLRLSLTYFDIDFKDRIAQPIPNSALMDVLNQEERYAVAITRNPDLARVQELYASPGLWNASGSSPEEIALIIDNRPMNIARRSEQGLDFVASYSTDMLGGRLNAQLSGAYLFALDEQVTSTAPVGSLLSTLFYPVDLRVRGQIGWAGYGWGVTSILSYVDDYRDVRTGMKPRIGSWTTMDMTARYDGFTSPYLKGTEIALSVLNAFDKAPPYVYVDGLNFDGANANPLGRFIALQFTHAW